MDEFLRINWRAANDLRSLEHPNQFISEEAIADSLVFQALEKKEFFAPLKKNIVKKQVFLKADEIDTIEKSYLDKWSHEQCLKALKIFQSGKDPACYTKSERFCVDTFNNCKSLILKENALYQNYACQQWQRSYMGVSKRIGTLIPYGKEIWEAKWNRLILFPQYYKETNITINMTFDENESIIDYKCLRNILDLGSVAKFSMPNVKSAFRLDLNCLPEAESTRGVYSNVSVSEDVNVKNILKNSGDIDLVVPLSGLRCIANGSNLKKRWMIPFSVKNLPVTKGGIESTKKVVFLDKPFSQPEITFRDLSQIAFKRVIKTNFCQFEAFRYDTPIETTKSQEADSKVDPKTEKANTKTIYRNVSYKLWNVKKTHCQNNLLKSNHKNVEFNVLIRSKLDACECTEHGTLQPVILRPKLENQPNLGACIASKEELANDWITLFFIPFSNLYRMGVTSNFGDLVYVEKCHIQKIAAEAQAHHQFRPNLSLGILEQTFERLITLEPGNYLLQHLPKHGAFIAVLKETTNIDCKPLERFDFHSESNNLSVMENSKNFLPIDVNFILPSFEAANRMPGLFTPRENVVRTYSRKPKKKKQPEQKPNDQ